MKDEIEKLWTESDKDLDTVIENAIALIRTSLENKSEIPLDTVIDILIMANNTAGFGSEYDDAKLLLMIYAEILNVSKPVSLPKVHRYVCLIYGVIFSLLSVDEATQKKKVPEVLAPLGVVKGSKPVTMIRTLMTSSHPLLKNLEPSYWSLELVSFILTGLCLLQDFDKLNDVDLELERLIAQIYKNYPNHEAFDKWKSRWMEANDYHRFTSTLIFAKHSSEEDAWLNRVKRIL